MTPPSNPATTPRKPRILLIPNMLNWILGEICLHMQQTLSDRYDFLIIPETLFGARPQLWDRILPEVDLIHCLNESSSAILARRGGAPCPVVTSIHHVTEWSPAHQAACQVSDAVVTPTAAWKSFVAARTPTPVYVVRYGVDLDRFIRVPGAAARFGIPADAFVAGFFASKASDSDGNRKGTDVLIDVMTRCAPLIPRLRILLLGPGWDARVFEEAGVAVTYPGFIRPEDLASAYSALDVYLMTARVEGGPVTVLEAMACGTPVVATRVGLVPDVLVDGVNGFSAGSGDVDALCQALLTLARDPALRERLAANARSTAAQLGWSIMLAPLAQVYDDTLASRPAKPRPQALDTAALSQTVQAADAILTFRYALQKSLQSGKPARSLPALKAVLRQAARPATLLRGYRLAARGELSVTPPR